MMSTYTAVRKCVPRKARFSAKVPLGLLDIPQSANEEIPVLGLVWLESPRSCTKATQSCMIVASCWVAGI
jgi:hypothetical protein